jgi:hypothetical protein
MFLPYYACARPVSHPSTSFLSSVSYVSLLVLKDLLLKLHVTCTRLTFLHVKILNFLRIAPGIPLPTHSFSSLILLTFSSYEP